MNFKFGATVFTSKEAGFCTLVPEAAGKEAAVVARKEAAVVARMEAAVVAGKEAAVVAGMEAAVVAGMEAAVVAGMEAAVVAGKEAAVVAGMEVAGIINFSLTPVCLMHMITYTSNLLPTPVFSFSACHMTSPTSLCQWQGSSRPTRTLQLPSVRGRTFTLSLHHAAETDFFNSFGAHDAYANGVKCCLWLQCHFHMSQWCVRVCFTWCVFRPQRTMLS